MNAHSDALRHRPPVPGVHAAAPCAEPRSAGAGALLIAGALVPLRDHIPNADLAVLALVIPVLLAGSSVVVSWVCTTAVGPAARTFDFIYTQP